MENGAYSLRQIEKFCHNDIRYMYLLDGMKVPSLLAFLYQGLILQPLKTLVFKGNTHPFPQKNIALQKSV